MANSPTPSYPSQEMEVIVETPDVRVAEITLAPRSDTPPHAHSEAEEICYCLEGELTCDYEGGPTTVLRAGQRKRFAAGSDHRLSNRGNTPCCFLLIHRGGKFDFIPS